MFDRDQYMKYVGSKSGSSYASGLVRIEKIYDVSIDEDYQADQCSNLLAQLEADKINPALDAKEQKQRSDMTSHLKKYIEFMQNSTAVHRNHTDNPNEQQLSALFTARLLMSIIRNSANTIGRNIFSRSKCLIILQSCRCLRR